MNRKFGGLILSILAAPALASGGAPFCVFSSGAAQCFYYDVQSCQRAAQTINGLCGANNTPASQPQLIQIQPVQQQQPQVRITPMMGYDYAMRGVEEGRRRGMEQREAEARIALLEAQTEALQQQAIAPQNQAPITTQEGTTLYRCPRNDGSLYYASVPQPGCVYLGNGQ